MSTKDGNPKDAIADTKVPLFLLSSVAKVHWALAQFAGLLKYGAWNWRSKGVRASVYSGAIERHFDRWCSGEDFDPVDGTHHLGNIMASCAILLDAEAHGKLTDDRAPRIDVTQTYAWAEKLVGKLRRQYADRKPKHYTISDSPVDFDDLSDEAKASIEAGIADAKAGRVAPWNTDFSKHTNKRDGVLSRVDAFLKEHGFVAPPDDEPIPYTLRDPEPYHPTGNWQEYEDEQDEWPGDVSPCREEDIWPGERGS